MKQLNQTRILRFGYAPQPPFINPCAPTYPSPDCTAPGYTVEILHQILKPLGFTFQWVLIQSCSTTCSLQYLSHLRAVGCDKSCTPQHLLHGTNGTDIDFLANMNVEILPQVAHLRAKITRGFAMDSPLGFFAVEKRTNPLEWLLTLSVASPSLILASLTLSLFCYFIKRGIEKFVGASQAHKQHKKFPVSEFVAVGSMNLWDIFLFGVYSNVLAIVILKSNHKHNLVVPFRTVPELQQCKTEQNCRLITSAAIINNMHSYHSLGGDGHSENHDEDFDEHREQNASEIDFAAGVDNYSNISKPGMAKINDIEKGQSKKHGTAKESLLEISDHGDDGDGVPREHGDGESEEELDDFDEIWDSIFEAANPDSITILNASTTMGPAMERVLSDSKLIVSMVSKKVAVPIIVDYAGRQPVYAKLFAQAGLSLFQIPVEGIRSQRYFFYYRSDLANNASELIRDALSNGDVDTLLKRVMSKNASRSTGEAKLSADHVVSNQPLRLQQLIDNFAILSLGGLLGFVMLIVERFWAQRSAKERKENVSKENNMTDLVARERSHTLQLLFSTLGIKDAKREAMCLEIVSDPLLFDVFSEYFRNPMFHLSPFINNK